MRPQSCQYSSVNSSWYLLADSSRATSRRNGTGHPGPGDELDPGGALSVIAVSTRAQLTSGPATRMPWFRSSTARPPPRARATPLPSCGVVTSPAVPSTDENCKRNPVSRPANPGGWLA